jgi:hypothetical protein
MPMDTVSFRDLSVEEFDTTTLLEHATQQAIQRRYEDFFIADIDGHHYETFSYAQMCEYIEDPVMRDQAKYQGFGGGGITSANGSYQELGGRVTRYPGGARKRYRPDRSAISPSPRSGWMRSVSISSASFRPRC